MFNIVAIINLLKNMYTCTIITAIDQVYMFQNQKENVPLSHKVHAKWETLHSSHESDI